MTTNDVALALEFLSRRLFILLLYMPTGLSVNIAAGIKLLFANLV